MRTGKRRERGSGPIFGCVKQAAMIVTMVLVTCSSPTICAAQKPARLSKIEVVGLRHLTPEQIIAVSELQIGQSVDPDILDAAANRLMHSGLFKRLTYRVHNTGDQDTVIFEVEEAARNLPVVFENFVWFSDDEIFHAIRQDVPFFDGTSPEAGGTADKIAAALQRLLNENRIPGQVEFLPYGDASSSKQELLFTVKGVKIPVCSLHFPGTVAVSEGDLIKSSQQLLKSDYSKKDAGEFAKYTLLPLYRHVGHLRARFEEPAAKLETDAGNQCVNGVAVTIPVDEGVAYSWEKAEWSGNQVVSSDELSAALSMKAGDVADGLKIEKGQHGVSKAYGRRGYVAIRLRESPEFDDAARRVTYRFTISEGQQYHMGNLVISGLSSEDAQQLRAKWTLASGAVFDESYLEDFHKIMQDFVGRLIQRSRGSFHPHVEVQMHPNAQKQIVDVSIAFK